MKKILEYVVHFFARRTHLCGVCGNIFSASFTEHDDVLFGEKIYFADKEGSPVVLATDIDGVTHYVCRPRCMRVLLGRNEHEVHLKKVSRLGR